MSNGVGESSDLPIRERKDMKGPQPSDDAVVKSSKSPKASHAKSVSISSAKKDSKGPSQKTESMTKKPEPSNGSEATPVEMPNFIKRRNQLFDELKQKHDVKMIEKPRSPIDIFLDLGLDKNNMPRPSMSLSGKSWESTPGSFLKHVDKEVSADVVVAKVNGRELWDLDRPLEYSCRVSYLPFTSPEGRNVFWHSSAHVLGEAAECQYNCLLSHGPPVEQGFFYDMALTEGYVRSKVEPYNAEQT